MITISCQNSSNFIRNAIFFCFSAKFFKIITLAPGTDVVILKIFSRNIFTKKCRSFVQNTAHFWFLRKTPIFFAENWQKSPKIVIFTLTPVM
jgi:hypothetical protein